jgi:AAA domain
MYKRIFNLRETVKHKSVFLFGPRQTGKSTLVRQSFPDAAYYDLLEADTFRELSARPEYLRQTLNPQQPLVIVDEIQKLPALLDEIQILIERNKKLRVILTGSSARKLKREPPTFSADVPGSAACIHLCRRSWMAQGYSIVSIAGVSRRSLIPSTTRKTLKPTWAHIYKKRSALRD